MRNLYSKKYCMKNLIGSVHRTKMILLSLVLCVALFSYAFAGTRIYYSPSNIYPILNVTSISNTGNLKVDSDGVWVDSYWADVHNQSTWAGQQHPNDKLTVVTNLYTPSIAWLNPIKFWLDQPRTDTNNPWPVYKVWEFGWTDNGSISWLAVMTNQDIWALFVTNASSYYLTSAYIDYFVSGTNSTTNINSAPYGSLSWLNIYFRACPATKDTVAPTFPNNATTYNTNLNFPKKQINRQYKDDFSWIFGLLDNTLTAQGSNGWIATPDFDAGTNFRPNASNPSDSSITNQNGINTWSFTLQIKIATGWNHSSVQVSRSNWWTQHTFTGSSSATTLTGRGKTWRYRDKNFTGEISPSAISDFGVEELVMVSGYVADRDMWYLGFNGSQTWSQIQWYSYWSGSNSTGFVYYFNQGMRPWFNSGTQWTFTHNSSCALDLDRNQQWVMIRTITGYLHDDRAGIDTSTIQIIVTGSILGVTWTTIYTISSTGVSLTNFSFAGSGCRVDTATSTSACTMTTPGSCGNTSSVYPGNWTTEVCNAGSISSTWNYRLVFTDTSKVYDPENGVAASIVYQDLKGKWWWPVACDRWVRKAPRFIWTGLIVDSTQFSSLFNNLFVLSNYPNGAHISPINIQLQDDRQGVNTGTIVWSITGSTLDTSITITGVNIDLAYTPSVYTQKSWAGLRTTGTYPNTTLWGVSSWLNGTTSTSNYRSRTGWVINSIPNFQLLNYELFLDQAWSSAFTWYFAPEQPVTFKLNFYDNGKYLAMGVSNPIDVTYTNDEAPIFREYTKTGGWTWGTNLKLNWGNDATGNYLTWEMAKLFSGNINSWENRIFPYDLTGDNLSQIGAIKQTPMAFQTTDNRAWVDSGTITVTVFWKRWWSGYTYVFTASRLSLSAFDRLDTWNRNRLNYFATLTGHDIYFDRQSRGWGVPVAWRESRYTITLSENDLKQPTGNVTSISFTRDMENLSCQYLNRCNARLYFTYDYGTWIVPVVQTWVHPFLWQTLYVIASWSQVIFTGAGNDYIACNGAGSLAAPIDIGWLISYNDYQHSELTVMDGMFQLNGNVLVLN